MIFLVAVWYNCFFQKADHFCVKTFVEDHMGVLAEVVTGVLCEQWVMGNTVTFVPSCLSADAKCN